jgi:hypothetical protein
LTAGQSLQIDDDKIAKPAEPLLSQTEPDLHADLADDRVPAHNVSLRDFLDHLEHPQLAQLFDQIGIKTDLDLLDILRWNEGDRNEWFQRFVTGKRMDPLQMETLRLEFMRQPHHEVAHPARIDHRSFVQRMDDTGLRNFLVQVGIRTEHDIRRVLSWDATTRDPFFHTFHLTRQISLFQLEVLRQVFEHLEM